MKITALYIFNPILCYILLLTQTVIFYYTKQVGTSTQIQNVSKLTAGNGNIDITSTNDLNIQSAYMQALNNVSLTSTSGSVNLTQNSSTANADHTSDITNYSSQTVANVIETGSAESTPLLIQKQKNNEQLAQLKIQISQYDDIDISQKANIEDQLNSLNASSYSMLFNINQRQDLQNKLNRINARIDIQNQIDTLNQSNQTISQQLQQNANQGSITINSAQDVNILASQNVTNNHSSYNETNMMYQIQDNHDLQIATTVSPLLSSDNITINSGNSGNVNGDNNINLLSAILVGQGNLNLNAHNGNVNMQSLQDLYYQYDFSRATSMNLGALLGMLLAAVVIGAVTGGAGALALGAIGAATVTVGTAVIGAAIASAVGVALQLGITAAIDANNGGVAATQSMQSGHMDSTTKQYQALVGNSLLFGGNVNTGSNSSIDSATSIQSNNINQTADNKESASYAEEHKNIGPDWNQLMMDAAINGVVSGVTVAAGPLISAGVGKAVDFAASGLTKIGLGSVVDGLSVAARTAGNAIDDVVTKIDDFTGIGKLTDDLANNINSATDNIGLTSRNGIPKQQLFWNRGNNFVMTRGQLDAIALSRGIVGDNKVAINLGAGHGDDMKYIEAGRFGKRPLDMPVGDRLYKIKPDRLYHEQFIFDDGANIGFGKDGMIINENPARYTIDMNSKYYDDNIMKNVINDIDPGTYSFKCNNCQTYADRLRFVYEQKVNQLK